MDLLLTNKKELVVYMKVKGILSCSDHRIFPFKILRGVSKSNIRITTLNFRRSDFGLLRDLLG